MVYRVYVEKRPGLTAEADALAGDIRTLLGISSLKGLRLLNRYDVENISPELFDHSVRTILSEPQLDLVTDTLPEGGILFAVEYLPGQFDQRADSAAQCIQILSQGERPLVRSARVYHLTGNLTAEEVAAIKKYLINPVESREASLEPFDTLAVDYADPRDGGDPQRLPGPGRGGPCRHGGRLWPGHGPGRFALLPGLLPIRGPGPHHHRTAGDRHLLVRPLPPHHLPDHH